MSQLSHPSSTFSSRPQSPSADKRAMGIEQHTIVLTGIGTRGDILPLIALASELLRRGQRCHVLGNSSLEEAAAGAGVPFTAVAAQQTNNVVSLEYNFSRYLFPSFLPTLSFLDNLRSERRRLMIVNLDNCSPSNLLAERYGLPLIRLYLAPYKLRSLLAPAAPLRRQAEGPLGRSFLKYTLPKVYECWDKSPFVLRTLNAHRASVGLTAIDSLAHVERQVGKHVGLFPSWYCAPAPDWPRNIELTGFPLPSSRRPAPGAFQQFVAAHGKPIVFTPGTGVPDVQAFFRAAIDCCQRLGQPGLFLSPYFEATATPAAARILHLPYLDLEVALRQASLLVHHGGIGTTARALQAGVPQIISPLAYDQPDNGERVVELGVGKVLERPQLTGENLAGLCRRLWDDPNVRAQLARRARSMEENDALARAADAILRFTQGERHAQT